MLHRGRTIGSTDPEPSATVAGSVDIYSAVLRAIAELNPGMDTLEYEDIRGSLRRVLDEGLPQAHEISRVLEHMQTISANDESSVPVIGWEKEERKLHITDPFFAFFFAGGSIHDSDGSSSSISKSVQVV